VIVSGLTNAWRVATIGGGEEKDPGERFDRWTDPPTGIKSVAPLGRRQGRLSPNNLGALPLPNVTSTPSPPRTYTFLHPTPTNNFWTFYTQFFSDTKNKKKYINGVGKAHCVLAFFKWRIIHNQASVAGEKIFDKMIGRL